ncbi:hypothetical protein PHMEG_00015121 [Phytophthora megakarya]|uniref:RNase H type-1 domain-containing protein n=1 Tax=Phytophthora megakarya TaxID=4795 RepID=A0A225W344_9STRA|nr:hypothetical protein PHMEG_00015121 [Phytophthora megakarya]
MSFPQLPNAFRYQDAGETSRYLGIQVGNSNTVEGSIPISVPCVGTAPQLLWMASVSLSSRPTTNNIAEYRGLKNGLSRAAEMQLRHIHVVGDSALIIEQMKHRKLPKAPHLRSIYSQCQGIVDRVHVRSWTHHIRAFNKAADQLANSAMDERVSRQIFKSD